jgi:hypothetical protein
MYNISSPNLELTKITAPELALKYFKLIYTLNNIIFTIL